MVKAFLGLLVALCTVIPSAAYAYDGCGSAKTRRVDWVTGVDNMPASCQLDHCTVYDPPNGKSYVTITSQYLPPVPVIHWLYNAVGGKAPSNMCPAAVNNAF